MLMSLLGSSHLSAQGSLSTATFRPTLARGGSLTCVCFDRRQRGRWARRATRSSSAAGTLASSGPGWPGVLKLALPPLCTSFVAGYARRPSTSSIGPLVEIFNGCRAGEGGGRCRHSYRSRKSSMQSPLAWTQVRLRFLPMPYYQQFWCMHAAVPLLLSNILRSNRALHCRSRRQRRR